MPAAVDVAQVVKDLNCWGWRDYKIEIKCGLGAGYVAQIRCGNIKKPEYGKAARLYIFWYEEAQAQGQPVPMFHGEPCRLGTST